MGEEARTGKRFPLELPIKIHKGEGDTASDAKGVTGNLSAAGVYIRADASMEIGSPVEFEITLPPEMTGGQENVTIQCKDAWFAPMNLGKAAKAAAWRA